MKIIGATIHVISVPYEAPTLASIHTRSGLTRIILLLETDAGHVGLGEGQGGTAVARRLRADLLPRLIGLDPFQIHQILDLCVAAGLGPRVYQAVEMACWDLMGKATDRPVSDLLGGAVRTRIPVCGYLFSRGLGRDGQGGEQSPEALLHQAQTLQSRFGFQTFKLKAGVLPPETEVQTTKLLRHSLGDSVRLRIDPNGKWSVPESVRYLDQLSETNLEWAEDPTDGIEGMAAVRAAVSMPLATNMAITWFDQILVGLQAKAVDVVLGDPGIWGGILNNQRLAAVCQTCNLGLGMHSTGHLGIATAACLHLVAATPMIKAAIDSHAWLTPVDITAGPTLTITDGEYRLPSGPGLGITLDTDALTYYVRLHDEIGDFVP